MVAPITKDKTGTQDVIEVSAEETESPMASMAADVASEFEAQISDQIQKSVAKAAQAIGPQIGEPSGWVDIYAYGPYQPGAQTVPSAGLQSRQLLPHAVIRVGEYVYLCGSLVLNPFPLLQDPRIVPSDFLSAFKLPYEIEFVTLNMSTGEPARELSTKVWGNLEPGRYEYTHCIYLQPRYKGCLYETNICFRVLDCEKSSPSASPLAGFATWVKSYDDASFLDGLLGIRTAPAQPGWSFNTPMRFMTYQ